MQIKYIPTSVQSNSLLFFIPSHVPSFFILYNNKRKGTTFSKALHPPTLHLRNSHHICQLSLPLSFCKQTYSPSQSISLYPVLLQLVSPMGKNPLQLFLHLPLALILLLFASIFEAGQSGILSTKTDTEALLLFKKAVDKDPKGVLSKWRPNRNPCNWYGVTCNLGRVTQLDLSNCNLIGTISFSAFDALDMLTSLNLSSNSFTLNSTSLLQLPYGLKQLELSSSGLVGLIPENLFTKYPNLVYVDLSFNNLTGFLPQNLLLYSDKLEILDLSFNNFTGSIANMNIQTCNSLSQLDMSGNNIFDSLPYSLSNCTNLKSVDFSYNLLTGNIPQSFGDLKNLQS